MLRAGVAAMAGSLRGVGRARTVAGVGGTVGAALVGELDDIGESGVVMDGRGR